MNASPSLTASSQEDYELKYRLLEDTLHIVDMEGWYGVPKLFKCKISKLVALSFANMFLFYHDFIYRCLSSILIQH